MIKYLDLLSDTMKAELKEAKEEILNQLKTNDKFWKAQELVEAAAKGRKAVVMAMAFLDLQSEKKIDVSNEKGVTLV